MSLVTAVYGVPPGSEFAGETVCAGLGVDRRYGGDAGCHLPGSLRELGHLVERLALDEGTLGQHVQALVCFLQEAVGDHIVKLGIAVHASEAGVEDFRRDFAHTEYGTVYVVIAEVEV